MTLRHATTAASAGALEKHSYTESIGGSLCRAYDWISDGVSGVYHSVWDTITGVVSTVHDDVKGVIGGAKDIITHTEDTVGGTIGGLGNNVQKSVSSVSSALSEMAMPLALGGVAVAFIYLQQQK